MRINQCGYEVSVKYTAQDVNPPDGLITTASGVATRDTSIKRSGAASLKLDSGASNSSILTDVRFIFTAAASRVYYVQAYMYFDNLPSATATVMRLVSGATACVSVRLTAAGKIQLYDDGAAAQIGSDSAATVTTGVWYRIALRATNNASSLILGVEARLDGVSVATGNIATPKAGPTVQLGWVTAPGASKVMYLDDQISNDSQGSVNNTWPDEESVLLLTPVSDDQVGTWLGGAGGTANLFDAVNNTPPIGTASETDLTQIESSDPSGDNSTDEYRGACQTYAAAGITAADIITAISTMANHGEDATSGSATGQFNAQANPSEPTAPGALTFGANVGALGTWPSNWRWKTMAPIEYPTVTLSSPLVLAVRKTDATAAVGSIDFMGAYVAYLPSSIRTGTDTSSGTDASIIFILDTDTGSGSEASAVSAVTTVSGTDTGVGVEASAVAIVITDGGIGLDAALSNFAVSDIGSGTENSSISLSLADTAAGVDASILAEANTLADTGVGSELSIISLILADTGSSLEIAAFVITASETGSGSENTRISLVAFDTGVSSDGTTSIITGTDTGSGTEASAIALALSDSGFVSDSAAIKTTGVDSSTGTDSAAQTASYSLAETPTGVDSSTLASVQAVSDSGSDSETGKISLAAADFISSVDLGASDTGAFSTNGSDSGAGSEQSKISLVLSEASSASDTSSLTNSISVTDTGSATDNLTLNIVVSDTGLDTEYEILVKNVVDAGSGIENISSRTIEVTEAMFGITASSVETAILKSGLDNGSGADLTIMVTVNFINDGGNGIENTNISIMATDTATSDQVEILTAADVVTDIGISDELASFLGNQFFGSDFGMGYEQAFNLPQQSNVRGSILVTADGMKSKLVETGISR